MLGTESEPTGALLPPGNYPRSKGPILPPSPAPHPCAGGGEGDRLRVQPQYGDVPSTHHLGGDTYWEGLIRPLMAGRGSRLARGCVPCEGVTCALASATAALKIPHRRRRRRRARCRGYV